MTTDFSVHIMEFVGRIAKAKYSLGVATDAWHVAREALAAAETAMRKASDDYHVAQNALVVAAGGEDQSFRLWPTTKSSVSELIRVKPEASSRRPE